MNIEDYKNLARKYVNKLFEDIEGRGDIHDLSAIVTLIYISTVESLAEEIIDGTGTKELKNFLIHRKKLHKQLEKTISDKGKMVC